MLTIKCGQGVSSFSFKLFDWNDYNRKAPEFMIASFSSGGHGSVNAANPQWQHDHGSKRLMISWSAGGMNGGVGWAAKSDRGGPYNASHTLIANYDGRHFKLVDWTTVLNEYQSENDEIFTHGSVSPDNTGFLIAAALIGGLATGIAALGPVGALPAGLVLSLGGLALLAFEDQEPPAAPNIQQIKAVIEKVIRDELTRDRAIDLSVDLLTTSSKFIELTRLVKSEMNDSGSGTTYEQQLIAFVNDQFNATGDGSLNNSITYLNTQPDIARLILPSYATGIGVHLHLRRLHALQAQLKGSPVTAGVVSVFLAEVRECRRGLEAAMAGYDRLCNESIGEVYLIGLAEAETLRELLNIRYLGAPTNERLESLVAQLSDLESALEEDEAGPITHFFNTNWLNNQVRPRPPTLRFD